MKTRLRSVLERVFSYGLVVVAVVVLGYFLTTVDQQQKKTINEKRDLATKRQREIEEAKTELANRQKQIESISQQITKRTQEVKEKFDRLLETSANYTRFIEQVQRKAKSLDIAILSSQYSPPTPATGAPANYLEFKFIIDVTGSYEKMKQFLWEMENALGRLVKISRMSVRAPICDQDGNMSLNLTLSTYFLP
jgi:Tfp pilus assembly protein PilO